MKTSTGSGDNEIKNEMLKQRKPNFRIQINKPVKAIWREEKIPSLWKTAVLCSILKEGDRTLCHNYRGITLLYTVYKILAICRRRLHGYQCGFRVERPVVDQIHTLRQIQEKFSECGV